MATCSISARADAIARRQCPVSTPIIRTEFTRQYHFAHEGCQLAQSAGSQIRTVVAPGNHDRADQNFLFGIKYFGGLTEEEIAEVLEISVSSLKRDWKFARSWLIKELLPGGA